MICETDRQVVVSELMELLERVTSTTRTCERSDLIRYSEPDRFREYRGGCSYCSGNREVRYEAQALFEDLMRPAGSSSLYRPPGSPANSSNFATPPGAVGPGHSPYQPSYMQPMGVNVDPALSGGLSLVTNPATMPAPRPSSGATPQSAKAPPTAPSPAEDDQDPKRHEAYKLIQYAVLPVS